MTMHSACDEMTDILLQGKKKKSKKGAVGHWRMTVIRPSELSLAAEAGDRRKKARSKSS